MNWIDVYKNEIVIILASAYLFCNSQFTAGVERMSAHTRPLLNLFYLASFLVLSHPRTWKRAFTIINYDYIPEVPDFQNIIMFCKLYKVFFIAVFTTPLKDLMKMHSLRSVFKFCYNDLCVLESRCKDLEINWSSSYWRRV